MQQSRYSNVVHNVMSSIYDYNDDLFPIKQQLAWLNYNMALSLMSSRKGRVKGEKPLSPTLPSPEPCKDTFMRVRERWYEQ